MLHAPFSIINGQYVHKTNGFDFHVSRISIGIFLSCGHQIKFILFYWQGQSVIEKKKSQTELIEKGKDIRYHWTHWRFQMQICLFIYSSWTTNTWNVSLESHWMMNSEYSNSDFERMAHLLKGIPIFLFVDSTRFWISRICKPSKLNI